MYKVKLGKYVNIKTGKLDANKANDNGKYPFFTCSKDPLKINNYSYDCECVLVAGNGDLNVKYYNGKFDAYQRTYIIQSKNNKVLNTKYLYYLINSNLEQLRKNSIGGVIKYIKLENLNNIEMNLINTKEQLSIVNKLDNIQMIIDIKKQQLEELENIIKAQFIKMFGDPVLNEKNFKKVNFINVVKLQRGYDLPNKNRNKNGSIPVYGANGILNKHTISKSKNGIITGRSGTIGKVYYSFEEFWPLNTTLFSIETYGNNIVYLKYLLDMFNLKRFVDATGVPTLNRNIVHKQQIIDVPIELQNQFANIVEQIDKKKLDLKNILIQMENLKNSLINKYFY